MGELSDIAKIFIDDMDFRKYAWDNMHSLSAGVHLRAGIFSQHSISRTEEIVAELEKAGRIKKVSKIGQPAIWKKERQ